LPFTDTDENILKQRKAKKRKCSKDISNKRPKKKQFSKLASFILVNI